MERLEVIGEHSVLVQTRQLGPNSWVCDLFRCADGVHPEGLLLEHYGESELEAVSMALTEAHH
jgi:hypothetical protein